MPAVVTLPVVNAVNADVPAACLCCPAACAAGLLMSGITVLLAGRHLHEAPVQVKRLRWKKQEELVWRKSPANALRRAQSVLSLLDQC